MAYFFYNEGNAGPFNYGRMKCIDPTNAWKQHLSNYFYLRFILNKSDDRVEKWQANKEMQIAERKMAFWEKNPDFKKDVAQRYRDEQKKVWNC